MNLNKPFIINLASIICSSNFVDKTDKKFSDDCLNYHNELRAKHKSPKLAIDNKLVEQAKKRCLEYGNLTNNIKPNTVNTENISGVMNMPEQLSCKVAIDLWYKQHKHYNFTDPKFNPKTAHFTALVWKESTKIGCARCSNGTTDTDLTKLSAVVCNYHPKGNVGIFNGKPTPKFFKDNVQNKI
ncbi:Golgi-associated plant pathogenesis-related protein 1-like [Oppia nitens]|uniref:Golgi-associated plant pathogenesis-related protein 1-like n=1 Tax=Oppia nitens TaxID=1686743 RepID=UPI0023DB2097|nr:Golgi-associated plant pathogenesis-related protein 1-like [Oppia nitens]